MSKDLLPIDKVAKQSGLASSALRYYERCGLISAGAKISGRRHYDAAILHRLSVIKVCRTIGFSLSEISVLLDGGSGRDGHWRELALARRAAVQEQIGQLHGLLELLDTALACPCHKLRDCQQVGPDGALTRQSPNHTSYPAERWNSHPTDRT